MPDLIDIVLPADQSEGTTNTVGRWFRKPGDAVAKDDPLLEIVTDKVTVEIAAPGAGVLAEILKPEGEPVEPGDVVGRISAGAAAPAQASGVHPPAPGAAGPADATDPTDAESLSPAVRRLLRDHGLEPSQVKGTGRGGRITVQDVEAHLAAAPPLRPSASPPSSPGRRVPHTVMRRTIADHMVRSLATAPHVTSVFEADLGAVIAHREAHRSALAEAGVKLTFTAYFVRAAVEAIRAVPEANSRWHDDALELFDEVHVGIATALGSGGLIVPVLRHAERLDLAATARGIQDLADRARAGTLTPADVQGGTFTISNHGVSGSLVATPIVINQPQSAILGVGKLQERPVVRSGQLVARPMLYVTLTIDHRVLDGFSANAFLTRWVDTIEGRHPGGW